MPDRISINSLWPLPDTPAIATISPARNVKSMSSSRETPVLSFSCRPFTSSTGLPGLYGARGRLFSIGRPTIMLASSSFDVRAVSTAPTTRPARITVTVSVMSMISCSLWVIRMIVLPCSLNSFRISNSDSVSCAVSTAVGSSRIRMFALR